MKFNKFAWENYLQTERGVLAVKDFTDFNDGINEKEVSFKYNQNLNAFFDVKDKEGFIATILNDFECFVSTCETPKDEKEAEELYYHILTNGLIVEGEVLIDPKDYKFILGLNVWISWILYECAPDFFLPNLFVYNYGSLNRIADAFCIELPDAPKKSDYEARCKHYWQLCKALHSFRKENRLTSEEMCAFLYDYAPNFIEREEQEMPRPAQAWFIGGLIKKDTDRQCFWQADVETKKGDILIHYETSPISAITCIWQSATDGVVDPFFMYYSNAILTNKIDVPNITLAELKKDEYFAHHPLVRKNFQGVNGWQVSSEDYSRLLTLFQQKGANVNALPMLYAPSLQTNDNIKIESDVEQHLLEPLLNSMGFVKGKDYIRRLPVKAGRGHRIIPDYALHYSDKHDEESAQVLVEAKFYIRSNKDKEDAFKQARSYAHLLGSSTLVLCDKDKLIVYINDNGFDRNNYKVVYWSEVSTPEAFNFLKNVLSKK